MNALQAEITRRQAVVDQATKDRDEENLSEVQWLEVMALHAGPLAALYRLEEAIYE